MAVNTEATDLEFIKAMEFAVKKKGRDHTVGARYDVTREDTYTLPYDTYTATKGFIDSYSWSGLLELGTFTPREGN